MSRPVLELEGVTRRFGTKTAVSELDLSVGPGTVLGLVGRNGAGKTTALRLAHGMLHPDAGRIRILGLDPIRQGLEVRTRTSLLSEESHLYPWMTVGEIIRLAASLHPRWCEKSARNFLERLELDPNENLRNLSRGTQAKVGLLLAVSCRPEVLLLDDPTAGLDPLVRREVLQGVIEALPAEGGAVVYASHLIHDVERVADRVAVLDGGRLALDGTLEQIKHQVRRVTAVFEDAAPGAEDVDGAIDWSSEGRVLTVVSRNGCEHLAASLRASGAKEVSVESLSLEEILVACLRRAGRREADHA